MASPEFEIYTAKPVQVREYLSSENNKTTNSRRTSAEDLSIIHLPLQHDSLTPSEDSDTTRVYDLNKRETSILRISTEAVPTTSITPPSSPIDGNVLDQHYPKSYYLDERATIQQLNQFKKATNQSSTGSPKLLSPVDAKRSPTTIVHSAVPKAKIIHSFPFKKMDDELNENQLENGTEVPVDLAPPPPIAIFERSRSTSPIPDYVSLIV